MHIHILQHVGFENPGSIVVWAKEKQFPLSFTRFSRGESLPKPGSFDLLVVMGGPMSIFDEAEYPWIKEEKLFIKKAISSGKKVLGICLGAQFIADALGAKVFPNHDKEIGWFNLQKAGETKHPLLDEFPETTLPAFHWHGDTFETPKGAIRLFESEATKNQAFIFENRIVALQFHWEVKPENVELLLQHSAADLTPGPYVQSPDTLQNQTEYFELSRKYLGRVTDYLEKL